MNSCHRRRMVSGIADAPTHPFSGLDNILPAKGEARNGEGTKARMGGSDAHDAKLVAQRQLVMNKIYRPDIVRPAASVRSSPSFALTRRFGCLFLSSKPQPNMNS
jgi:hypothetical protein